MNYKEKLNEAIDRIRYHRNALNEVEHMILYHLTDLLYPCGENGCPIGPEDYCDDIYYVYAEPKPNEFYRVTAIRNKDGRLQVRLDLSRNTAGDFSDYGFDKDGWMDFYVAHIPDLHFLVDEVEINLEYCDGYQPEPEEKVYDVPFLRSQWTSVRVKAVSKEEALEKATAIFREGHDGDIDWEDVDIPEYDNIAGVQEADQ